MKLTRKQLRKLILLEMSQMTPGSTPEQQIIAAMSSNDHVDEHLDGKIKSLMEDYIDAEIRKGDLTGIKTLFDNMKTTWAALQDEDVKYEASSYIYQVANFLDEHYEALDPYAADDMMDGEDIRDYLDDPDDFRNEIDALKDEIYNFDETL